MKTNEMLGCIAAIGLALSTAAQGPPDWNTAGNNIFGGEYLGGDGTSTVPLRLQTVNSYPIDFFTHRLQRMQLCETRTRQINGFPVDQNGYLGVSRQPDFLDDPTLIGPFSRLHLCDSTSNTVTNDVNQVGFRDWMKNGVTMTGNGDQCYMGAKYRGLDTSDMVIQWSDDAEYDPYATDRFRLLFTNDYDDSPTVPYGARSLEGLESFRVYVPNDTQAFVGIGDWWRATHNNGGAFVDPDEQLDVLDRTIRIRRLVPDYETDTMDRVVVADYTGRLYWTPAASLSDNCEWTQISGGTYDDDVYTAYGTVSGCPDKDNSVGIGTIQPAAKLDVLSNVVTDGTPPLGVQVNLKADGSATHVGALVDVRPHSGNGATLTGVSGAARNATTSYGVTGQAVTDNSGISNGRMFGVSGTASCSVSGSTIDETAGVRGESTRSNGTVSLNRGMYARGVSGTSVYGIESVAEGSTYSTTTFGAYAYADGAKTSGGTNYGTFSLAYGQNAAPNYGVYGKAEESTTNNYGVYGFARKSGTQTGNNYGVYGWVNDTTTFNWAGYFSGKVRVTGNAHIANLIIGSDANLKTNIQDLEDAGSIIAQLSPKTYEFVPGLHVNLYPPNGSQIGLIAQEVEQVLPELVESVTDAAAYDEQGNLLSPALTSKGINYIGLIPVLIGAVKEQQATIAEQNARLDALEQDLAACCESGRVMQGAGGSNGTEGGATNELRTSDATDQRLTITPNPFSEGTVIGYSLRKAGMVSLQVSDASGKSLFNLFEGQQMEGTQRYDWNTSFLAPGMYHVTLLVDGTPLVKKAVKVAR